MSYLSRALERVRAVRSGRLTPSKCIPAHPRPVPHAHPPAPEYPPTEPPSPDMMSALLALARLHRTKRPSQLHRGERHPLVRTYVLPPEDRQRALLTGEFTGAGR